MEPDPRIGRRAWIGAAAATLCTARALADLPYGEPRPTPICYVGHGGPSLAIDPVRGAELARWGRSLDRPSGILAITPHYRARGIELGAVGPGHALFSFPPQLMSDAMRALRYEPPSNEGLATRVEQVLSATHRVVRSARAGQDHTTWMPLLHLRPAAEVPVLELALPFSSDEELVALGRALAPLRGDGVMLLLSGNVTHNLAAIGSSAPAPWAQRFDEWLAAKLEARDLSAIIDWRRAAPDPYLAHPDDGGHYDVLLVGVGALGGNLRSASFPVVGFETPSLSKRCIELG